MLLSHGLNRIEQPSRDDVAQHLGKMQNLDTLVLEKSPETFLQVLYTQDSYLIEYRQSATKNLMKASKPANQAEVLRVFGDFMEQMQDGPPQLSPGTTWEDSSTAAPNKFKALQKLRYASHYPCRPSCRRHNAARWQHSSPANTRLYKSWLLWAPVVATYSGYACRDIDRYVHNTYLPPDY
jgi:hypothetical protein